MFQKYTKLWCREITELPKKVSGHLINKEHLKIEKPIYMQYHTKKKIFTLWTHLYPYELSLLLLIFGPWFLSHKLVCYTESFLNFALYSNSISILNKIGLFHFYLLSSYIHFLFGDTGHRIQKKWQRRYYIFK